MEKNHKKRINREDLKKNFKEILSKIFWQLWFG